MCSIQDAWQRNWAQDDLPGEKREREVRGYIKFQDHVGRALPVEKRERDATLASSLFLEIASKQLRGEERRNLRERKWHLDI